MCCALGHPFASVLFVFPTSFLPRHLYGLRHAYQLAADLNAAHSGYCTNIQFHKFYRLVFLPWFQAALKLHVLLSASAKNANITLKSCRLLCRKTRSNWRRTS